jgi:DNA-binding winged helix-turn-helix (wHTH) protein
VGPFRLGEWLIFPDLDRIVRDEVVNHVEPKIMDVLVLLATRPGHLFSRVDIIDAVWAKKFIGESALSRAVALLRDALGDDAQRPRFVETIPKRGYRLLAPVEPVDEDTANRVGEARARAAASATTPPGPQQRHEGLCGLRWGQIRVSLGDGEHLIGRDPEAVLRIPSSRVSRRHARIAVSGAHAVLEDMGSRNGTFVRGRRVTAPTELSDGDEICVGPEFITFAVTFPEGSTEEQTADVVRTHGEGGDIQETTPEPHP